MSATVFLVTLLGAAAAAAQGERVEAPPERAYSAFSDDPARRFDFWIGRWSVNLRMLQDDLSFEDTVAAEAHIYPILDGKAILELWDSRPIVGYSLRYFDPERGEWVLWLDWPGESRSSVASLAGRFRHGRGDFYATSTSPEGEEVVTRYSFNDVTPFSLRWDDLRSSDGGRTWRKNWIMEFTRTSVEPRWPIPRDDVPTFDGGGRCSAESFRPYEVVAGSWRAEGARLEAYRILDGCAVVALLEAGDREEFLFLTYLTREQAWETDVLDARPGTGLVRYRGADSWSGLAAESGEELRWSVEGDRLDYRRGGRHLVLTRQ